MAVPVRCSGCGWTAIERKQNIIKKTMESLKMRGIMDPSTKERKKMERFFKLKERGTTVKTEFVAGMTTFFAMLLLTH